MLGGHSKGMQAVFYGIAHTSITFYNVGRYTSFKERVSMIKY